MPSIHSILLLPLTFALAQLAVAHPLESRAAFTLQNGRDAISLNAKFASLSKTSCKSIHPMYLDYISSNYFSITACVSGTNACIGDDFAQCANGKFIIQPCAGGLVCRALPLVNSPGTSITCDTAADAKQRIATTGAKRNFEEDDEDVEIDEDDIM